MSVTRPTPVRGPRATAKSAAPLGIHTDAADTLDLTLIREEEQHSGERNGVSGAFHEARSFAMHICILT